MIQLLNATQKCVDKNSTLKEVTQSNGVADQASKLAFETYKQINDTKIPLDNLKETRIISTVQKLIETLVGDEKIGGHIVLNVLISPLHTERTNEFNHLTLELKEPNANSVFTI